ncbi:hypothetical protein QUF72_14785 [Desulfobacterales bacterium HSG2]|nr:hypothetical protein [Desulfobacterales bacterium HSG2]
MGLREKLRELKKPEPELTDWETEKEKWLVSVRNLFNQIQTWFSDMVKEDLLKITESEIMVVEEDIGRYMVPRLEMKFAGRCAILEPVGTNIAMCEGGLTFF